MSAHNDWTALIWGKHVQGHDSEAAHQVQCGKHWAIVAEIPLQSIGSTHGEDGETLITAAEAIEHAYLIAAAPDLALQLLAASNYIDALGGDSKSYRAAIAKAKGEA